MRAAARTPSLQGSVSLDLTSRTLSGHHSAASLSVSRARRPSDTTSVEEQFFRDPTTTPTGEVDVGAYDLEPLVDPMAPYYRGAAIATTIAIAIWALLVVL